MEREIKFRQPIRDKKGKFLEWFYWGFMDGTFITPLLQLNGINTRQESQQFTGLKDKSGVEIYEGDVLENTELENDSIMGTVVFCNGSFGIESPMFKQWNPISEFEPADLTVIGNTIENKDENSYNRAQA